MTEYYVDCGEVGPLPLLRVTYSGYYYARHFMRGFAELCRQRRAEDKQTFVVCDGHTSSGKSNKMLYLARQIDPKWDVTKNMIYHSEDLWQEFEKKDNYNRVFLLDEMSTILHKKQSMTREAKSLMAIFDTARFLNWTYLMCCPSLYNLNSEFVINHVDYVMSAPKTPNLFPDVLDRHLFIYKEKNKYTNDISNMFLPVVGGMVADVDKRIWDKYMEIKIKRNQELRVNKYRSVKTQNNKNNGGDDNPFREIVY